MRVDAPRARSPEAVVLRYIALASALGSAKGVGMPRMAKFPAAGECPRRWRHLPRKRCDGVPSRDLTVPEVRFRCSACESIWPLDEASAAALGSGGEGREGLLAELADLERVVAAVDPWDLRCLAAPLLSGDEDPVMWLRRNFRRAQRTAPNAETLSRRAASARAAISEALRPREPRPFTPVGDSSTLGGE